MTRDITNQELLEAIKENRAAISETKEEVRATRKLVEGVVEQVARNSELITDLQANVASLPEQLAVRTSRTFLNHDERIERLEKETGLAV